MASAAIQFPRQKSFEPFTAVPNSLLDILINNRIPGEQGQVLNYVIRNSFGWHVDSCSRDISAISQATGLNKPNVCRAIGNLIQKNILVAEGNQLSVNMNVSQWNNTVREPVITSDNGSLSEVITKADNTIIVNKHINKTRTGSFCEYSDNVISYREFNKYQQRKKEISPDFGTLFNSASELDKVQFQASIAGNLFLVMQFRKKGFSSLSIQMKFVEFMTGHTETSAATPQKCTEKEKLPLLPSSLDDEPEKEMANKTDTADAVKKSDAGTVDQINKLCKQISEINQDGEKRFNPYQFAQGSLNAKSHPGAVVEALASVIKQWPVIDQPWAYANKILGVQSGNYHSRDFERDAGRIKKEYNEFISENSGLVPGFSMKSL